jgi:hypothetical protein
MYTRRINWKGRVFEINRVTPEAAFRDYLLMIQSLSETDPKQRTVLVRAA